MPSGAEWGSTIHGWPASPSGLESEGSPVHTGPSSSRRSWNAASWARVLPPAPLPSHQLLSPPRGASKAPSSGSLDPTVTCALQVRSPRQALCPLQGSRAGGAHWAQRDAAMLDLGCSRDRSGPGLALGSLSRVPHHFIVSTLAGHILPREQGRHVQKWTAQGPRGQAALGQKEERAAFAQPPQGLPADRPRVHSGRAGWRRRYSRKGELHERESLRGAWPGLAAAGWLCGSRRLCAAPRPSPCCGDRPRPVAFSRAIPAAKLQLCPRR